MSMRRIWPLATLAALAACGWMSNAEAVKLVRSYNAHVIDAYRAGDVRLVDSVVGPEEGKKLTGLIGVKLDMGVTMDAKVLEFRVLGVERRKDEVVVRTEERWYYRDVKIGTGEQVGQDSADHYVMRYHLRKPEGRWVVDAIVFDQPPEVGRTVAPEADVSSMHGVLPARKTSDGGAPVWRPPAFDGTPP
jgi:hypothetical protein